MVQAQKGALNVLVGLALVGSVYYIGNYLFNEARDNFKPPPNNRSSILDPKGPVVQFILYTRKNPTRHQYLILRNEDSLKESFFNQNYSTKIIIHGYMSSIREEVFYLIKDAYLSNQDYNIIGVDWSALCSKDYISAINGAYSTAQNVSALINWLSASRNVKLENIHIIGHSLGAHVAGLTADRVAGRGKISRITGLDPAGPGFKEAPEFARLDPNDAEIVDIIHTSMQVLSLTHPVGHVDFYPNGGKAQPGCPDLLANPRDNMYCNHGRAYFLFSESINNKKAFKSNKCNTVEDAIVSRCLETTDVYMGQAETYKYGLYYVKTKGRSPFSLT